MTNLKYCRDSIKASQQKKLSVCLHVNDLSFLSWMMPIFSVVPVCISGQSIYA